MIASEAQDALLILQRMIGKSSSIYWLERYERALDECTRNPSRTSPPSYQVRNALANARKRIDERNQIAPRVPIDGLMPDRVMVGSGPDLLGLVDILQWLDSTPAINANQRALLRLLAEGEDAESLATRAQVPVASMRQRISRARAAAWRAWTRDCAS